ncbi:MAG TPA: hypothetical protein VIM15_03715 [Gemmatimonadaceae bacterium]
MERSHAGASSLSGTQWWNARRHRYNVALIVAGIVAFYCYVGALEYRCANVPGADVTVFTTAVQGIVYLVAMGVANVCYQLGPALERFVGPEGRARYRKWAFTAGLTFSVFLPFAIPLMTLTMGCGPGERYL